MSRILASVALVLVPVPEAGLQPVGPAAIGPQASPEETVSLLGKPLHRAAVPPDRLAVLEADLAKAQGAYDANRDSEEAAIWLGRRLAYLGRYNDAVAAFSKGLASHPDSHRLLRHRGHRFITLRRLDDAIADLTRAAALIEGKPDEVEPDGAPNAKNLPRSTGHSNIYYHLGLAHYLKGDFDQALATYRRCMEFSRVNDDMLCATSHWLYMTLRRLDQPAEAAQVLTFIRHKMDIIENHAYHRLLLLYKGELTPDSLLNGEPATAIDGATVGYGVGNWRAYNGDRAGAAALFERVIKGPNWASFGFIAAEAELARTK